MECALLLPQARAGYRMGNGTLVDAMIQDGLWEAYRRFHMGVGAEMIAEKYGSGGRSRTHLRRSRTSERQRRRRRAYFAKRLCR